MCSNTTWQDYYLCFTTIEEAWTELAYTWFTDGGRNSYFEDLEALLVWRSLWYLHISQEFEVHLFAEESKSKVEEMDGTAEQLWLYYTVPPKQGKYSCQCFEQEIITDLSSYLGGTKASD
jgi:hypothetical protein